MAEKKVAKKKATPKAKPKKVVIPESKKNPGAVVRTMQCDKARAAELVERFGFFVVKESGDVFTVAADLPANVKYEASR